MEQLVNQTGGEVLKAILEQADAAIRRLGENMFYGKMESRNEGIIFPACAGVILLLYMNFSTK